MCASCQSTVQRVPHYADRWHYCGLFFIQHLLGRPAASWHKRLDAHLPPLGSRVHVSIPPSGFRGGRNRVWVGFSRGFSHFPLPQISFHHFSTLISSISFHFISPCDGASGVVSRHPCYSRTYNIGLHRISSLNPTLCWTRVEDIYLGRPHCLGVCVLKEVRLGDCICKCVVCGMLIKGMEKMKPRVGT